MNEREFFERNAERVLQFFINKVDTASDASDLAQETFTRFYERRRRGDVIHPRAFLFGVANFVLKEYWKSRDRRHREPLDVGERSVVEMGAPATSLTSMFARKQGHQRVLAAMRRLRLDFQNVLELHYWHGLKYREIAEILGQNDKTVGVWLRRAKQELRRQIEQEPDPGQPSGTFSPQALEDWLRSTGDVAREATEQFEGDPTPSRV